MNLKYVAVCAPPLNVNILDNLPYIVMLKKIFNSKSYLWELQVNSWSRSFSHLRIISSGLDWDYLVNKRRYSLDCYHLLVRNAWYFLKIFLGNNWCKPPYFLVGDYMFDELSCFSSRRHWQCYCYYIVLSFLSGIA